jgi:prepilin-type N-terminal cleavage/methylation domain-containing protein
MKGFTLLEVLMTNVLLAIGLLSILYAFSIGLFASSDVENVKVALGIAQGQLEKVKNMDFASIDNISVIQDADFPDFSYAVNVVEFSSIMKRVEVAVSWIQKNQQVQEEVTTLVTDLAG